MTKLRVCFVGDSITNGTGDTGFLGWPGRLCAAEVAAGHDLTDYNLGIRGDTSAEIGPRWRTECEARLPASLNGAVVFNFGLNDATEQDGEIRVPMGQSIKNVRTMITDAKALYPTIWVGPTPVDETRQPMITDTGDSRDKRNRRTADYNLGFKALAYELEIPYLDMMSKLINEADWPSLLADGLHPNPDGHQKMAGLVGAWDGWRKLLDG
ncbi:MAG: lipase [Rhodospirillaceae bacterium]|nr:lipase [Rhodospirillaceae bacterium]